MPKFKRTDWPLVAAGVALAGLMAASRMERRVKPRPPLAARPKATARAVLVRPTWRNWKEIARRVYKAVGDDRLLAVAAGIVFYGLLAFFPAVTALISLYGLFADPATIRDHLNLVAGLLPEGGFSILREQVERVLGKGGGQLSLAFLFGTGLAIWSTNAGMKAMMDALNVIYNVAETRGFIRLNAVSLALTIGGIAMLLLAIGIVVVFPLVLSFVGLGAWNNSFAPHLRWPLLFFGVLFGLAVLYRFGPSPRGAQWRWITPGSAFATILWGIGSGALSYYLANFGNYNATYGSLGAAIGLMMWMWMSSVVILLGAQLNNTLDTWNDQPEKPMQQTDMQTPQSQRAASG